MWQTRSCARAFQACSSPPFCKYYQLAKNQKIALGPAVKKSLSFPEGNLSVWGILTAALHLHRHHREGAAGSATPLLTTPFGLLLQEWGPEHVLLLGPDFS